jgi:hypothetical protein
MFGSMNNSQGVKYGHVKMYAGGGKTIESASGGVQMRPADWGWENETRRYLGKGGVIIGGESGAEAVLPLTDPKAMQQVREGIGGGAYYDQRRIYLNVQAPPSGRVDVKALWREINAIEGKATRAARRGSVRR